MPFVPLWRMVLLCFDRGFQADSLVYLFAYAAIEAQDFFCFRNLSIIVTLLDNYTKELGRLIVE
jgi:hypothetical protein